MVAKIFRCLECDKLFRVKIEEGEENVECPHCDGGKVRSIYKAHD